MDPQIRNAISGLIALGTAWYIYQLFREHSDVQRKLHKKRKKKPLQSEETIMRSSSSSSFFFCSFSSLILVYDLIVSRSLALLHTKET